MTGFDLWLSVLALGIVCNIYTALVIAVNLGDSGKMGEGKEGPAYRDTGNGMQFQGEAEKVE